VLCRENVNEQLTKSDSWPQIPVKVKGREVRCPGILLLKDFDAAATATTGAKLPVSPEVECPDHPDEDSPLPIESVWEMPASSDSLRWSEDEEAWSERSVAD